MVAAPTCENLEEPVQAHSRKNSELTTLHELSAAQEEFEKGNETPLRSMIKPMEMALQSIPQIVVRDSAVDSICHGASLAIPGIAKLEASVEKNKPVALFTLERRGRRNWDDL